MNENNNKITLNINNQFIRVEKGTTILRAAEQNDIYIPSLCSHSKLDAYGGCRLCIVEVDGIHGLPTACTTPVEEGMRIRTDTPQVQALRLEVLQMLLSEHTSGCLICDEKDECRNSMSTIRKAGVTTGCRYCPKDGQCELQEVVEKLGLKEINSPIRYRNLPAEKNDPFFDRDYNLCILCGRCVRICQEVRGADVLAFNQRGQRTVIGPAFGRSHIEAGCEFCGACVEVCPTGALAEKSNKWDGQPEREQISTCALCGVGCQMRILIKRDKVIGTLPAEDQLLNNGQLCVKGRFCVNELVNDYRRLKQPYKNQDGTKLKIKWEKALDLAAEKLSGCPPENFGMLISPNCSNEDLYIAQKFTRLVMKSHNIDTGARLFYGAGFNAYLNLMKMSIPLSRLSQSSVVLCIGLDLRYGRSVVGVQLRKAIGGGTKLITINPRQHSLSLSADKWLQPDPGEEVRLLDSLVKLTEDMSPISHKIKGDESVGDLDPELSAVVEMLRDAVSPLILVGSDFLQYANSPQILERIGKLARSIGAGVLPLPAQNNLYGSLMLGAYSELLPGGFPVTDKKQVKRLEKLWAQTIPAFNSSWNAEKFSAGDKLKLVYLIGEVPLNSKPPAEFTIFQNIYPSHNFSDADLVLPAAAFTEIDGTFINGEGRIQRVRKAVSAPGDALADWEILCRIAQKMGITGFDYSDVSTIHKEIATLVSGFGDFDNIERKATPLPDRIKLTSSPTARSGNAEKNRELPLPLTFSVTEHSYRGVPLADKVDGFKKINSGVQTDQIFNTD